MKLEPKEVNDLQKVVEWVMEFEHEDYEDWVREIGHVDGHVYFHAEKLSKKLEEWERQRKSCCEEQAKALKDRWEFFGDES